MRAGKPSRTAEYMALFRAVESRRPRDRRLFSDPIAAEFLGPGLRAAAAAARLPGGRALVPWLIDRRGAGARVSGVVRTRLIDDALRDALAGGARQVVILGAGYDSRLYRIPGIEAARGFELDHPDTQSVKRRRLERALGSRAPHVTFVATDFVHESPGTALLEAGYDPTVRTFFIWEGVTNYLNQEAVDAVLRFVGSNAASASRLSFTYVHRGLLEGSVRFPGSEPWVRSVRRAGEPFTFGLDPDALADHLGGLGLRLLEDSSTAEGFERLRPQPAGRAPPAFYRVALAAAVGAVA